jgi:hypothetical protein
MRQTGVTVIAIVAIVIMIFVAIDPFARSASGQRTTGNGITGNVVDASGDVPPSEPIGLVLVSGFVPDGSVVTLWDGGVRFDGGQVSALTVDLIGDGRDASFVVRKSGSDAAVVLPTLVGPTGGSYAELDVTALGRLRSTTGPGRYVVVATVPDGGSAAVSFVLA